MTREMFKDQERGLKPILDEYEKEEFDRSIAYAMEYNLPVKIKAWSDGVYRNDYRSYSLC
jgi:YolD-like protein